MATNPSIHESWREALKAEFSHPYMEELKAFLVEEKKAILFSRTEALSLMLLILPLLRRSKSSF